MAVAKPGGGNRFRCVTDYRLVNNQVIRTQGQLPHIEELTGKLAGAKCLATFDLFKGFWQAPLDKETAHIWSMVTSEGYIHPKPHPTRSNQLQ
jgi:hypothetical protein